LKAFLHFKAGVTESGLKSKRKKSQPQKQKAVLGFQHQHVTVQVLFQREVICKMWPWI